MKILLILRSVIAFDWEQRKFGEITELKSASRVHREEWTTEGIPFYRSSDVMSAINGTQNEKAFISKELYEKLSSVSGKLEKGDILVTGGGSVGNPYIVPDNEPLYTKDADLLWIKNKGRFDSYFVYEFFLSPTFKNYLGSVSHVGTIAHYTITQLSETPISLPSMEEQKKIGNYFQNLDHLITLHQRNEEQQANKVTIDWEQRKFGKVFSGLKNNTFSRAEMSEQGTIKNVHYGDVLIKYGSCLDASNDEIPFIADSNSVEKYSASFLQDGDIIIADTAEDTTVGKCTEIQGSDGYKLLSGLHTIPCRPNEKYAPGYMGYYMNSAAYHDQLIPLMQGIKVTSISKSALQETDMMFPKDYEEQKKIGSYFHSLDTLITLHQCKDIIERKFVIFDWEQRKLEEYLEVSKEKNKAETFGKEDVLSVSGEFGIVNQIEFQGRSFAGTSVANYGVVDVGDVVYTKSPLKTNPYGIIKTNKGKSGIVSTLYAVYKAKKIVDPEFVQIYFELDSRMNSYMHPLVNKGAKNDMKVSDENALKGPVIFPQIEEQKLISRYFESLDHLITLHQQKEFEQKNIYNKVIFTVNKEKGGSINAGIRTSHRK